MPVAVIRWDLPSNRTLEVNLFVDIGTYLKPSLSFDQKLKSCGVLVSLHLASLAVFQLLKDILFDPISAMSLLVYYKFYVNCQCHKVSLDHNVSFWAQKPTHNISFWATKLSSFLLL